MRLYCDTYHDDPMNERRVTTRYVNFEWNDSEEEKAEFILEAFKDAGYEFGDVGEAPCEYDNWDEWWGYCGKDGETVPYYEYKEIREIYKEAREDWEYYKKECKKENEKESK